MKGFGIMWFNKVAGNYYKITNKYTEVYNLLVM